MADQSFLTFSRFTYNFTLPQSCQSELFCQLFQRKIIKFNGNVNKLFIKYIYRQDKFPTASAGASKEIGI